MHQQTRPTSYKRFSDKNLDAVFEHETDVASSMQCRLSTKESHEGLWWRIRRP